jgi:hypothetical protein
MVLFVYWFRSTCLLILNEKATRDYSPQVAEANQLQFLDARNTLSAGTADARLELVAPCLDRDYRMVTYLLRHAASYDPSNQSFEQVLLKIDYKLMRLWYFMVRKISQPLARQALLEMTSVIGHLAQAIGEKVAVSQRTA